MEELIRDKIGDIVREFLGLAGGIMLIVLLVGVLTVALWAFGVVRRIR